MLRPHVHRVAAAQLHRQGFAAVHIDDGQRTEFGTIGEVVGYEMHAPCLVGRVGVTRAWRDATILRRLGSFERNCSCSRR